MAFLGRVFRGICSLLVGEEEECEISHSTPDQELENDEITPTPEESLSEAPPPPSQRSTPRKAPRRPRRPLEGRSLAFETDIALSSLKELHTKLHKSVDPMVWLARPDTDNELANILPLWTKDCTRTRDRRTPLPLELFLEIFSAAHTAMSSKIRKQIKREDTKIRGEARSHFVFGSKDARILYLATVLDLSFEKLCGPPSLHA